MNKDKEGILVIDKPVGWTSHDVVAYLRGKLKIKKIGHAGTLDPFATGVLVVLVGRSATKKSDRFLNEDKEYEADLRFGVSTDTGDPEGKIIENNEGSFSEENLIGVIERYQGRFMQKVPMTSAKKINGIKLYKLAHKGLEIERPLHEVHISKIRLKEFDFPFAKIVLSCSKGTYVRQLAIDLGRDMRVGAHLTKLRRMSSGAFTLEGALKMETIKKMGREELNERILRF